ncbi:MAG: hypothetical protein IKI88_05525 [Anaerotignum sp.]|nr:hypothetical protein [Anaerotignum sp.]
MAWLVFVTLSTIYWCMFMAAVTGRLSWALLSGWLVPIFAMAVNFEKGMAVNGLMVLICFVMFLLCRRGLVGIRMWNTKVRKKHTALFAVLYFLSFLFLFYSLAQAQIQGYLLNIQGWGSEKLRFWRLLLTILPLLALNYCYTEMVVTGIDRLWLKKQELILLACRCFIAGSSGREKGLLRGYYMDGIHNGVTHHFQMTRRTYAMLRREKTLRLQIQTGLLGGVYVSALETPEFLKRVRRGDRKAAIIGSALFVAVLLVTGGLLWFGK